MKIPTTERRFAKWTFDADVDEGLLIYVAFPVRAQCKGRFGSGIAEYNRCIEPAAPAIERDKTAGHDGKGGWSPSVQTVSCFTRI